MHNCKKCGTELTALNISDDDNDYCQKCFAVLIDEIPIDDESEETRTLPDWGLDMILQADHPQGVTPQVIKRYGDKTKMKVGYHAR